MATGNASFLFASPPSTFRYLLIDALVALGLPYGPQAREELARALPELFGRSRVTLSGYQRWLARSASADSLERFAEFMETRYQRWRQTFSPTPTPTPTATAIATPARG